MFLSILHFHVNNHSVYSDHNKISFLIKTSKNKETEKTYRIRILQSKTDKILHEKLS